MSATPIFPLALWIENTNQNSTPANDNALRIQALIGPAIGFSDAAPAGPAAYDQYVIRTAWGGFGVDNIVIYLGGTWKEFASYSGLFKSIGGVPYYKHGGYWDVLLTSGS